MSEQVITEPTETVNATPTTEPAPTEQKVSAVDELFEAKTAPADSASKQLALIARENKRLAAEKVALKAERESTKSQLTELETLRALKAEIESNPLKALSGFGLSYEKLIESELSRQAEEKDPTIRRVKELEAKLVEKDRIEADKALAQAKQTQELAINSHVNSIKNHIIANVDKYEFLNTYNAARRCIPENQRSF